jgi:hypothetical protein
MVINLTKITLFVEWSGMILKLKSVKELITKLLMA